jgi:hypothetical protein
MPELRVARGGGVPPAAESRSTASGNKAGKTGCLAAALAAAVVIIALTLFVIAAAQK